MKGAFVFLPVMLSAALAGCGPAPAGGTPGLTNQPTSGAPTATPPGPVGGVPAAEQLCALFSSLAVGVLGGPVDEPQFGDVVPRPNGVYCRYSLTGNANTNVEVQVKEQPQSEAESLADTLGADIPVAGVGDLAFRRDSSSLGGGGVTIVAWSNNVGVTVIVNREGADQALMNAAAEGIAQAVLAAV